MSREFSELDRKLCQALCNLPRRHNNRYDEDARHGLLEILFRSLTNDRRDYLNGLFPNGFPQSYKLQEAQGVEEDAEYTTTAKGHPCGHILKPGEASYHCMTCTNDPTAVLCARCFFASDHEGHQLHISVSQGNSGCCDCGDPEAWKRPVKCAIHTETEETSMDSRGSSTLPEDLQLSIRKTISCVLDYFCDVISCSPENLRLPKSVESVKQDELRSRLVSDNYTVDDDIETNPEFCLIVWNDEKHTVREVQEQVVRACRERKRFGEIKADEANDIGRSVVKHSRDLKDLIRIARIIEEIKITVTIRSSRDTFREQMCGTIIDWLSDIAGCTIAGDSHYLRNTICEEMLHLWRVGSEAWNAKVGQEHLDDHGDEDSHDALRYMRMRLVDPIYLALQRAAAADNEADNDDISDDDEGVVEMVEVEEIVDEMTNDNDQIMGDVIQRADAFATRDPGLGEITDQSMDPDVTDDAEEMDTDGDVDFLDVSEQIEPDQPTPPNATGEPTPAATIHDPAPVADTGESPINSASNPNYMNLPRTISGTARLPADAPPNHWLVNPSRHPFNKQDIPLHEDLTKNIRIDSMILFDLRLWKLSRTRLRDLYISTVVKVTKFKRILGLRFSGLYPVLAQLYLVADREPDHSVINLSLQMFTTPSITEEVIERGNFLTNLMAILYTFLTKKQVGFPKDIDPGATLGFDAGSVANRRMFHFFSDLRYFLASPFVQSKVRSERQYLFQYLDLAKLSQGLCPNVRAVGEHVEYETDAWISASLLTREINKLCRQFAETYQGITLGINLKADPTFDAIFQTTANTIINAIGIERKRFDQAETKDLVRFHEVGPFGFIEQDIKYSVVDFPVDKGALSFHHPLHYTLSWLLECGKETRYAIIALQDAASDVLDRLRDSNLGPRDSAIKTTLSSRDDALLAMFDYPLRVCAWLAQMRANMWVRNGMSLRHQMNQYKGVAYRDVGHQRDLFLLQTALVTCEPVRVLASMIDRFGLSEWMNGDFPCLQDCEDIQMLDLAEDFIYLLINILSDRDALISRRNEPESQLHAVRKDIAHTLCFKPLSYSDLSARLTERAQDHEQLQDVLDEMTKYRPPEGLHDSGLFELKEEYLQELDPYNSHFSKNQRDEAENIYKKWMAKKVNKQAEDIVLEPKLHTIHSEAYKQLCAIVREPLFARVIQRNLTYVAQGYKSKAGITATRVDTFLHIILQLALVATLEDNNSEVEEAVPNESFVQNSMALRSGDNAREEPTIVQLLHKIWLMEEFTACRSKIRHILRLFNQKLPREFGQAIQNLDFPFGRFDTASPANAENELEARKKQALERKAKVLAQFQQQQQNFMDKQGMVDWGEEELTSPIGELPASTESRTWKYPTGLCIQCREDTSDARLYGTFSMLSDAHVLRQSDTSHPGIVKEVLNVPENLDRSMDDQRPFGISGSNFEFVDQLTPEGKQVKVQRQALGQGWPHDHTMRGSVSTSCGHIMHYACFENYYQSIDRRHSQQVARNHPERKLPTEFVCPLCKALANAFLPIVWKSTEQSYPGSLRVQQPFDHFLETDLLDFWADHQKNPDSVDLQSMTVHKKTLSTFFQTYLPPVVQQSPAEDLILNPSIVIRAEGPDAAPFKELASIYGKLKEPLSIAGRSLSSSNSVQEMKLNHFHILVDTLANTVAAVEIAYRGREAEYGTSLLSAIPQQTLTHLQILASTVRSYSATGAILFNGSVDVQYRELYESTSLQLFGLRSSRDSIAKSTSITIPLIGTDAFQFFVQASMVLCPTKSLNLRHILQLSFYAELLKVLIKYSSEPTALVKHLVEVVEPSRATPADINAIQAVFLWLENQFDKTESPPFRSREHLRSVKALLNETNIGTIVKLTRSYALAFMRKAAIFFHVAHGIDLPTTAGSEASLPELERLLHLMQIPSVNELLSEFSEFSGSMELKLRAGQWVDDWIEYNGRSPDASDVQELSRTHHGVPLLHPTPLELIGLPKYFDVLHDESHRRKCPTTGKELTDPVLCLFCGEMFCSQAVCCMSADMRGGCNTHVDKCSSPIGIFLFIRKCHVVLLHVVKGPKMLDQGRDRLSRSFSPQSTGEVILSHGSFFPAPYLTKHGETDSGLRSKSQLILNQKRYDKLLRDTWLMTNGSVWSTVARKLESEVNAGGWETL